mgnify:CR=1 FL=1
MIFGRTAFSGGIIKITILGAGLVGSAIAKDLAGEKDFEVTVSDASAEALKRLGGGARMEEKNIIYKEIVENLKGSPVAGVQIPA